MNTPLILLLLAISLFPIDCDARCRGCDLALASYYVAAGQNLTEIAALFGIQFNEIDSSIIAYNRGITSKDSIHANSRIDVPFQCNCIDGEFLGHSFRYTTKLGDTYARIAADVYHDLTTVEILSRTNAYDVTGIPSGADINATVKCFCGDAGISRDYGLFVTYPLRRGDTLESVAADVGFSDHKLLQRYNPNVDFDSGGGLVFVPRNGLSPGAIAGICVAAVAFCIVFLSAGLYIRSTKGKKGRLLENPVNFNNSVGSKSTSDEILRQPSVEMNSPLPEVFIDKSVVYSYEELAKATDNFSLVNKIGQGGFGAVYYAEIRGEKTAIKKMPMEATRVFLAELKILTHVHHVNLVRLMGYCADGSLFLIYEYMENGNLSERLRGPSARELQWPIRVRIALESARGLEYIHDHTNKLCIHCDVKSANILIDKDFHAKVADFGLAKLSEFGDASVQSKAGGTFGYMSPEYARYGELSTKVDVYAFGVVLYELISGKPAVVQMNELGTEPSGAMDPGELVSEKPAFVKLNELRTERRGLIDLFEDVFSQPDPKSELPRLVDPNLGSDYPLDLVYTMAQLARICSHEDPRQRPDMREVVLTLMTISSSTAGWDVGALHGDPALLNLISGR
ncbi:chitin elicitor receptor kinase 1 [Wolffia australiana]